MNKVIGNLLFLFAIVMITWVCVSYVDIVMHNLSGHSEAEWNFFNILLRLFG